MSILTINAYGQIILSKDYYWFEKPIFYMGVGGGADYKNPDFLLLWDTSIRNFWVTLFLNFSHVPGENDYGNGKGYLTDNESKIGMTVGYNLFQYDNWFASPQIGFLNSRYIYGDKYYGEVEYAPNYTKTVIGLRIYHRKGNGIGFSAIATTLFSGMSIGYSF